VKIALKQDEQTDISFLEKVTNDEISDMQKKLIAIFRDLLRHHDEHF
jgi:hypothetical protein